MQSQRWLFRAPVFLLLSAAALCGLSLQAQTAGTPDSITQKLSSQYALTKATADHSDVVTAGAVLVLKKDGLMMSATGTGAAAANTYKDGHFSHGVWGAAKVPRFGKFIAARAGASVDTRIFVTGEKFWITKITVHDDGIVLDLLSDPFSDVRYYATLKFPFAKGTYPSDDDAVKSVAEVLDVAPADNSGGQQTAATGQGGAAPAAPTATPAPPADPAPAPMAAIPPPPPPSDAPPAQPKTIALKQTKEQVVAIFGQPTKVVRLGTKEIDYYPDMKVTFVNDKVTDVQ